jgi:phosphoribosyl-ATP pyrophosphohydrolase
MNNETQFSNIEMPIDYLAEMLKIQKSFQDANGYNSPLIIHVANAILVEGGELSVEAGAKWWKKYQENIERWGKLSSEEAIEAIIEIQTTNRDKIQVEAIDILHFLLIVFLVCGLDTSKSVFDKYCAKMNVNVKRQETGY